MGTSRKKKKVLQKQNKFSIKYKKVSSLQEDGGWCNLKVSFLSVGFTGKREFDIMLNLVNFPQELIYTPAIHSGENMMSSIGEFRFWTLPIFQEMHTYTLTAQTSCYMHSRVCLGKQHSYHTLYVSLSGMAGINEL